MSAQPGTETAVDETTSDSVARRVAEWIRDVNSRETAAQPLRWVSGHYHIAAGITHVWNDERDEHLTTQQMAACLTEIRDNPLKYGLNINYRVGSDGVGRWQPYKGVFRTVTDGNGLKTLTFDPAFIDPIQRGEKTATIRYGDEKEISDGDRLRFITPDETLIGYATAHVVEMTTVREAPRRVAALDAKHGADSWRELRDSLETYYDDDITAATPVKLIIFSLDSVANAQ